MTLTLVASQTVHLQHIKAYGMYKKWKCPCSHRLTLLERFPSTLTRSSVGGTVACLAVDLVHAGSDDAGRSRSVKGPEPTESSRSDGRGEKCREH